MPIKILPYPQKFSIPTSLLIFISTKLLTCPWNKFTHANKISHMHHEYVHTRSQHRFFTMPMLPKSKPKFIQQHHKLPTLSKFHKPPILSKLHHDKKNKHFKNAPKPTLQHDQLYNAPNFNKDTQQNDNGSPSNFQWSMKQHFSKPRNQRKTHLEVHVRIWSMGLRVLKEAFLLIPIKC